MKLKLILFFLIFHFSYCYSQQNAVTETGRLVMLFPNGTWKFKDEISDEFKEVNTRSFNKNPEATFLYKSKKNNSGFWVNPKKWKLSPDKNNASSEYEFTYKEKDLYGLVITEGIEMPFTALKKIAFDTFNKNAKDAEIIHEEYRIVNGNKILLLYLKGNYEGFIFSYYGYYFSNEKGTTQFIVYSSSSIIEKNKGEIESFLNGLVSLKN
jgi:hypothetical protein